MASPSTFLADDNGLPKETAVASEAVLRADLAKYEQWTHRALYVFERAAKGDLEGRLLDCEDDSDIARLSHAINQTLDLTDAFVRESGAALDAAAHRKFFRKVLLEGLLGSFRQAATLINKATETMSDNSAALATSEAEQRQLASVVGEVASSVTAAAAALQVTARSLKQNADSTAEQVTIVTSASKQTSEIVQSVAAATEELSATAAEIERRVRQSAQIAEAAVLEVERTNITVGGLASAQTKIGSVVKSISHVPDRPTCWRLTPLLKLHAQGRREKGSP